MDRGEHRRRIQKIRRRLARAGPHWQRDRERDFQTVTLPERDCDLVRDLLIAEAAETVVEVGLAYGSSALAIGEALITVDPPHPRHVIIDPFQEQRNHPAGRRRPGRRASDPVHRVSPSLGRRTAVRELPPVLTYAPRAIRPGTPGRAGAIMTGPDKPGATRRGSSVATTFADLEARVRGLESRTLRAEEDITAIVTTIVATGDDVRWLRQAVQALLDHHGIQIDRTAGDDT